MGSRPPAQRPAMKGDLTEGPVLRTLVMFSIPTLLSNMLQSLSGTGRSLMPDGLEAAIDFQAMADLIAFIAQSGGVAAP